MRIGTAELNGSRILIAGLGLSGLSVSHVCEQMHIPFISFDEKNPAADIAIPQEIPWDGISCMVISPGFPPSHFLVQQADKRNIPVWSEVEFAWHVRVSRNPQRLKLLQNKGFFSFSQESDELSCTSCESFVYSPAPWIGITGTNGKTTTTEMISAILQQWGLHAPAVGNIGVSLSEAARDPNNDVLCVELSSFALHFTFSMRLDTAVWLNVAEDHLDWHGGFENYWKDKARIFNNNPAVIIFNAQDPIIKKYILNSEDNKAYKKNENNVLKINTRCKKSKTFTQKLNTFSNIKLLDTKFINSANKKEDRGVRFVVGLTPHKPLSHQIGIEKDSIVAYDRPSYYSLEHCTTVDPTLGDYCVPYKSLIQPSRDSSQDYSSQDYSHLASQMSPADISPQKIVSIKGLSAALCDSHKKPYPHLLMDALAATAVGYMYGVPHAVIYRMLHTFRPEAHRLEYIETIDHVAYVDDSKATNPHAAQASLKSFPLHSVVWIAGGLTKKVHIRSFIKEIKDYLAAVIIIGREPQLFSEAIAQIAPQLPVHIISPYYTSEHSISQQSEDEKNIKSGKEVIEEALEAAREEAQPGQVILLAPAAASMDQFKNYGERGTLFSSAVKNLLEMRTHQDEKNSKK